MLDKHFKHDMLSCSFDKKEKKKSTRDSVTTKRRTTECLELSLKYEYRRAFSEVNLINSSGLEFKENHSYNFLTAGDVDGLSYLKLILNHQNLDYCLISTWVINAEDILQIENWVDEGKIKRLDMYLGEIFPNSYKVEFLMIQKLFDKFEGLGRYAVFKNHSKIFAGYGDKFHFGIQTSANINTNPRTENGCITINKEIFQFYKEYFDGINSFEK